MEGSPEASNFHPHRREATTSTSNGDDPPPVLDRGNFEGFLLLQGEDPVEPPFPLGSNFGTPNSEDSMPTGVMEDKGHHSFQNRIDYTQISCDFDTPCEWFIMQDWTVQNKIIGNVSDLGVYYSGNYLLFQYDLPGVSTIVTNDVIVSKFNTVFCLSFVYYLPGPSGVLYVQIVDYNTGEQSFLKEITPKYGGKVMSPSHLPSISFHTIYSRCTMRWLMDPTGTKKRSLCLKDIT